MSVRRTGGSGIGPTKCWKRAERCPDPRPRSRHAVITVGPGEAGGPVSAFLRVSGAPSDLTQHHRPQAPVGLAVLWLWWPCSGMTPSTGPELFLWTCRAQLDLPSPGHSFGSFPCCPNCGHCGVTRTQALSSSQPGSCPCASAVCLVTEGDLRQVGPAPPGRGKGVLFFIGEVAFGAQEEHRPGVPHVWLHGHLRLPSWVSGLPWGLCPHPPPAPLSRPPAPCGSREGRALKTCPWQGAAPRERGGASPTRV